MLDFIEQEVSSTSPPELSLNTPTESDNLPDTKSVSEIENLIATKMALAPWLEDPIYIQTDDEEETIH
jgi:hypothetical protein